MRCPQCASENPADYRFCGMCGTPLEKPAPVAEPVTRSAAPKPEEPVTVPPTERKSHVERFVPPARSNGGSSLLGLNESPTRALERVTPERPPERVEHVGPQRRVEHVAAERPALEERISPPPAGISGPSFLGLGGEAPRGGYHETSRDLNYLFEDDEQPKRTYWRFTAIMLVLAVFAGLAYLQYRRGGNSWTAPWSKAPAQTPVQASQTQPGDQGNAGQNAAQGPNASAAPAAPNSGTNQPPNAQDTTSADGSLKEKDLPPQGGASTGPEATGTQGAAAGSAAAGTGAQGAAPSESPADAAPKDEKTSKRSNNEDTTETASAAPAAKNPADAGKSAGAKESGSAAAKDTETEEDTTEAADIPAKPAKSTRTKPGPQVAPASPDESLVTNAEKYLYGRGVPQNCDRALISLKAAANRQNARAQTLLGTMYFTGHCVSKDLPNSYRWFAQASRQSPDNMLVQRNLEMIWRTMTPAERQLATARQ